MKDEAPERTRCEVGLKCQIEFRPDVAGIEGSIGEGEKA